MNKVEKLIKLTSTNISYLLGTRGYLPPQELENELMIMADQVADLLMIDEIDDDDRDDTVDTGKYNNCVQDLGIRREEIGL